MSGSPGSMTMFLRLVKASVGAQARYPASALMLTVGQFLVTGIEVVAVWAIGRMFHSAWIGFIELASTSVVLREMAAPNARDLNCQVARPSCWAARTFRRAATSSSKPRTLIAAMTASMSRASGRQNQPSAMSANVEASRMA